jgi:hypothetical protein
VETIDDAPLMGVGQHGRHPADLGVRHQPPRGAAAGNGGRISGSAKLLIAGARPEMRRRRTVSSRPPATDHPPAAGANRDASRFLGAPASAPSGRHAPGGRADCADNAAPPPGSSTGAPAGHSRRGSRPARGRSRRRQSPGPDSMPDFPRTPAR